jgi:hypothetical protein
MTVKGDKFKPKKLDVLGQIADFFLQGRLSTTIKGQNMRKAMEGITNPNEPEAVEKVIRRVATFDHKAAMDMYQKHVDDRRADEAAKVLQQQRKLQIIAPFRSEMGMILQSSDDPTAQGEGYKKLLPYWRSKRDEAGLTENEVPLPDEWDPDLARSFYRGGILPEKWERLTDADQRLGQKDRALDQVDRKTDITERQGDARIGIAQQNANTGSRRADNSERMTDSRIRDNDRKARDSNTIEVKEQVKDKNGKTVTKTQKYRPGEVMYAPDRKRAMKNENGRWVKYIRIADGSYKKALDQN